MKSVPGVFIIESLDLEDEKKDRFEGKFISHILKLGNIPVEYYYIRTKKELKEILKKFKKSKYRYLHMSCHGNDIEIATTFDTMTYKEFGEITKPYLSKKRLFISACKVANRKFGKSVIPISGCLSITGPSEDIDFDDAAIFWATFYHIMYNENYTGMKNTKIKEASEKLSSLFKINLNFIVKIKSKMRLRMHRIYG